MKKPWSITTTLRNPERLRSFLIVLKQLEGESWNLENQRKYQILLIKERVYGYGSTQFYNGLNQEQIDLIDDQSKEISLEKAEEIFDTKNYEDPAMRGRQSINPLKKIGLVVIKDEKIFVYDVVGDFDIEVNNNYADVLRYSQMYFDQGILGGFNTYIKFSFSADAQNQRHRRSPAIRPNLESIYKKVRESSDSLTLI